MFGRFDLLASGEFRIARLSVGGDIAANPDQIASQRKVVDDPAVVGDVRRGRSMFDKIGEVSQASEFLEGGIALKLLCQQNGFGELSAADMGLDGVVKPAVKGFEKVPSLQVVTQSFIGRVVVEQNSDKRLFRFNIRRCMRDGRRCGGIAQIEKRNQGHPSLIPQPRAGKSPMSACPQKTQSVDDLSRSCGEVQQTCLPAVRARRCHAGAGAFFGALRRASGTLQSRSTCRCASALKS